MRSSVLLLVVATAAIPLVPAAARPERRRAAPETRGTPAATFLPASPDHAWSFPRDHFVRPGYRNEWWYFTGLTTAGDGRRLGFQVTFFKVGLLPAPPALDSAWATGGAVMAHLAVTDVAAGRHVFSEVVWRDAPLLAGFGAPPGPAVAFAQAPPGTDGRWTLDLDPDGTWRVAARDDAAGLALSLSLRPRRPVVLQGPNGYSRKAEAPGFASEYYSQTRLEAAGEISIGGRRDAVRGEAWMDREVGSSQLAPQQVGWDWFALRLADGRDLMLYVMRRADGSADWRSATLVARDGTARALDPAGWTVEATGAWRSPESGVEYPSGWRVEVPSSGLSLVVVPEVAAAENRSRLLRALRYWEGPVRVTAPGGAPAGEGYVELAGRGEGSRPPL